MSLWKKHAIFEKNSIMLLIGILVVIAIGGLVEITPLFYLKSTIEKVDGVRPYTPLELAGRNIYVREGCYNCHSQMIRPLRDEVERYGHYSLAAESMYDRPFQWGSKRTGPDLARVGGKYSDDWHRDHLQRAEVGGAGHGHAGLSVAGEEPSSTSRTSTTTCECRPTLGVPYTRRDDRQRAGGRARRRRRRMRTPGDLSKRYPEGAGARLSTATRRRITEADALIAYLQMLGTLVDFKLYDDKANIR